MLEVKLHKNVGHNHPIIIKVPENWGDFDGELFAKSAFYLNTLETDTEILVHILHEVMNLHRGKFSRLDGEVVEAQLLPLLGWIKETRCDITQQLLPTLKVGNELFYGPESALANTIAVEFNFMEQHIADYFEARKNKDINASDILWLFMGTIYRPARKVYEHGTLKGQPYDLVKNAEGDKREPYNFHMVDTYAQLLKKHLPIKYAYANLLFFKACHMAWREKYPRVWKKSEDINEETQQEQPTMPGYFNLMRLSANDGIYGNFESVERMYTEMMLNEFECILEDAEKTKEATDKMRTGTHES